MESEIQAKNENEMEDENMVNNAEDGQEADKGGKGGEKSKTGAAAIANAPGTSKVHKTHADQRREERKI